MFGEDEVDYKELVSNSDSETEDDNEHEELLRTIVSLGQKKTLKQRDEPSLTVSEFHLFHKSEDASRIAPSDLLSGLSNKKGLRQLKLRLDKVNSKSTPHLLKSLSKVNKEKIHRKVAYDNSTVQISRWEPIVKHNRKVEHLHFPVQSEIPPIPSLSSKVDSFKPFTDLEQAVAAVLNNNKNDIPVDQELSEAEKKALLKLSLQEAKERRADLRKMRALISSYEVKQKRLKRIKSKKFHKVQRKRREREEAKKIAAQEDRNEPISEDLLAKAERLRAMERATLKHSRMSKWAKEQLARKHRDSSVRLALTEHDILKSELKRKHCNDSDSDEDSVVTESDHGEEVEDRNTVVTDSSNPWLQSIGQKVMKGAEPVLLLDSEMMSQTGSGNISKHSQNQKGEQETGDLGDLAAVPSQENESDEETWQEKKASENESDDEKYGSESSNIKTCKHSKPKTSNVTSLRTKTIPKSTDSRVINPDDFLKTEDQGEKVFSLSSDNLLAVQEAFAGDDVVEEFLKDKQEELNDGKQIELDTHLPGWGSWGGLGVKEKSRKRQMFEEELEEEEEDRKDANLKYVIINQKRDKKVAKHMVSNLPFPLTNDIHFKKVMATPIGQHWNTETRYNDMIKPSIKTDIGSVIEPMKLTDEVQDFIKKTNSRSKNKYERKNNSKRIKKRKQNVK